MTLVNLPQPIAAFVSAANACDLNGLVAAFAADAFVNDQLNEHWGRAAIRDWAESEMIADKMTIFVVRVVEHYGHFIVTANIDGDYDKRGLPEPLVLTFYFPLRRKKSSSSSCCATCQTCSGSADDGRPGPTP